MIGANWMVDMLSQTSMSRACRPDQVTEERVTFVLCQELVWDSRNDFFDQTFRAQERAARETIQQEHRETGIVATTGELPSSQRPAANADRADGALPSALPWRPIM
jgi:hypothetical protein